MKIELLNGFTRVNPQDTKNVYNLEGPRSRKQRRLKKQSRLSARPMIIAKSNRPIMDPEVMKQRKERRMARRRSLSTPGMDPEVIRQRKEKRMARRSMSTPDQIRSNFKASRRLNPQQMLMGYDVNYFLKDNALYTDAELLPSDVENLDILKKLAKRKKSRGIKRASRKADRRQRRADKKQARKDARIERREDRQEARRTRRTDRQEAKRVRQEQRQASKLARTQARQDRKLAQTEARQQDNIIKAQAKADQTASGGTFGAKAGEFLSNIGDTASQFLSQNPQIKAGIFENIEDQTGLMLDPLVDDPTIPDEEPSFIEKYKIPLIIGGLGVGAYLFTRKKK